MQRVIPHLSSPQQHRTDAWMIERILTTGELPVCHVVSDPERENGKAKMSPVSIFALGSSHGIRTE